MKNNYTSKIVRTITSILPVDKGRGGSCNHCGGCCELPNRCAFLGFDDNKSFCKAYMLRPLNCRKYPRTGREQIAIKGCGFNFEDGKE